MSEPRIYARAKGRLRHDAHNAVISRRAEASPSAASLAGFDALALGTGRELSSRANEPVRIALLQRMQQTWGNHAVIAYVQRLHVQRCGGVPCNCAEEGHAGQHSPAQEDTASGAKSQ